jgi:hypothetical protein
MAAMEHRHMRVREEDAQKARCGTLVRPDGLGYYSGDLSVGDHLHEHVANQSGRDHRQLRDRARQHFLGSAEARTVNTALDFCSRTGDKVSIFFPATMDWDRLSQYRVPLSQTKCAKNSGHFQIYASQFHICFQLTSQDDW